jgi:predicted nucleotide-binding protein
MEKRILLPKQRQQIAGLISAAGFTDDAFAEEERESKAWKGRYLVSTIIHVSSGSYFYFDSGVMPNEWWFYRSPGGDIYEKEGVARSWENETAEFSVWLSDLKDQLDIPEPSITIGAVKSVESASAPNILHSSNTARKIFIGHGRSNDWKDLRDFIRDRLELDWDEFNREPQAGRTTKERLEEMLNESAFALLIMTAEDEHADQTKHARANVIHEIGLFQGRLGYRRASVVGEDGGEAVSNVHGWTEVRFRKGEIMALSEEIRRILEREQIISVG